MSEAAGFAWTVAVIILTILIGWIADKLGR